MLIGKTDDLAVAYDVTIDIIPPILGVILINSNSVSVGSFVCTNPIRFAILCTCVSTHTEGISIAYDLTHAAVFLPTIGSFKSSSVSEGTMPSNSSQASDSTL